MEVLPVEEMTATKEKHEGNDIIKSKHRSDVGSTAYGISMFLVWMTM